MDQLDYIQEIINNDENEDFVEGFLNSYTPIRLLGSGAFSRVYEVSKKK